MANLGAIGDPQRAEWRLHRDGRDTILDAEAVAHAQEPRATEGAVEHERPIESHRLQGGDAVAQPDLQVVFDTFRRLAVGVHAQADHHPRVHVQVDQARQHVLAG